MDEAATAHLMSSDLPQNPIRVVVVEDDVVTRKAICLSVQSDSSMTLAATFDSVLPATEWMQFNGMDVLLTDLGLPDGSGLQLIQSCCRLHPDCDIMVLTTSSNEADVVASIEAGASGYLLKGAHKHEITQAIRTLCEGGAPMSPVIARMVLGRMRSGRPKAANQAGVVPSPSTPVILTGREAAILDLIARGDSYGDIAKMLSVTVGTVQTHIKSIYAKLSVHSRGEAVFEAQRQGLLKQSKPGKSTSS